MHLRLVGIARNYDVSFSSAGSPRTLSIIAGEISTGKTSVLELIDYCLGDSDYPRHQEIQRQARAALLEVDLSGERVVIERSLGASSAAFVHQCALADIDEPHGKIRRPIAPAGDPQSLSSLLLAHCGLAGISLKEAPGRADSKADPLSFRDLMWLCFLPSYRMDSRQLMHEGNYMQELKLRQVIEVVFGIHDDQLAQVSNAIDAANERKRELQADVRALQAFLEEQAVESPLELSAELQSIEQLRSQLDIQLSQVDSAMAAETTYGSDLRRQYAAARRRSAGAAATKRDRELFDPLQIVVCPSCLQKLPEAAAISNGLCSLCGQEIVKTTEPIDVSAELFALRTRRRELDVYITEVEEQLTESQLSSEATNREEVLLQERLDSTVASRLAPFVAQRDDLVRSRERLVARRSEIQRLMSLHDGLVRRHGEIAQIEGRTNALRTRLRELESTRPSRASVVGDLSTRFREILVAFGFPKLFDPIPPEIDSNFAPHVRGLFYRDVGSAGAMTLASLAWFLAVSERAQETGASHPGFLMIDSPQKNLTPSETSADDEYKDPAIAFRVWQYLLALAQSVNNAGQLIIVDNAPPEIAEPNVVVRYSGKVGQDPYGLIENETG